MTEIDRNLRRCHRSRSHPSLVIGHWSLVIGHWSLVIGHWSLVIGHWSLAESGGLRVKSHWSAHFPSGFVSRTFLDFSARVTTDSSLLGFLCRLISATISCTVASTNHEVVPRLLRSTPRTHPQNDRLHSTEAFLRRRRSFAKVDRGR